MATAEADDHRLAARLAEGAGQALSAVRAEKAGVDPADLRAAGDRHAQQFLASALAEHRPDDAVLSEEAGDDPTRLDADRVWIIDPLDGTREFSEAGRSDWAVHVALWVSGDLAAGAVALPARATTLCTPEVELAPRRDPGSVRIAVSRSRPPQFATMLVDELGGRMVEMGSAGVKAMSVVTGHTDVYIHAGGQYEWDSAAPVAVARAAGLHTSRVNGDPLEYNRPNPLLPDLLICRPEFAHHVLAVVGT